MQNEGLLGSLGMNANVMVMTWDWERLALYVSVIRPSCFPSELRRHGSEPSRPLSLIPKAIQLQACIFFSGHLANEIVNKC